MTYIKAKLLKPQQMGGENTIEQDMKDCTTLGMSAKAAIDQVKETYKEFKTQLNAHVISN